MVELAHRRYARQMEDKARPVPVKATTWGMAWSCLPCHLLVLVVTCLWVVSLLLASLAETTLNVKFSLNNLYSCTKLYNN